jgi:hypothetical protein
VPGWIDCGVCRRAAYTTAHPADDGSAATPGEDVHILVRAVAFPDSPRPGYAVVVDVPITKSITERLRLETGVELKNVSAVPDTVHGVKPIPGRETTGTAPPVESGVEGGPLSNLRNVFEYHDWVSGEAATLMVSMRLSVGEVYDRISSSQGLVGRSLGQGLLVLLFIIGGLFLIIEFVALVAGLALASRSPDGPPAVHRHGAGPRRLHARLPYRPTTSWASSVSFNSMTAISRILRQAAEKAPRGRAAHRA